MAIMNLLWEYNKIASSYEQKWSKMHGIFLPRLKRIKGTCDNLQRRVAEFLKVPNEFIQISDPPCSMPHAMITILRIIQVWVFNETLIQFDPSMIPQDNSRSDHVVLPMWHKSVRIQKEHMEQILKVKERHPFFLIGQSILETKGSFPLNSTDQHGSFDVLDFIEERLISYSTDKNVELVVVDFKDSCAFYFRENKKAELLKGLSTLARYTNDITTFSAMTKGEGKAKRGRDERPCGLWKLTQTHGSKNALGKSKDKRVELWCGIMFTENYKTALKGCDVYFETSLFTRICLNFTVCANIDTNKISVLKFSLMMHGMPTRISDPDLKDLFASMDIQTVHKTTPLPQKLLFPLVPSSDTGAASTGVNNNNIKVGSVDRPLIQCIPEAARLLSVLASSRRGHDNIVCLLPINDTNGNQEVDTNNANSIDIDKKTLDIYLDPKQTNIVLRWKRFGTPSSQVYTDTNTVPGSAVPMYGTEMLYCTCSNTLEVRGGGLRAEGLTLLPPGKLFVQLCRFTFGIYHKENVENGTYITKTIEMIDPDCSKAAKKILTNRITQAVEFNESSMALGEKLLCFPEKVASLVEIFNGVDGYECTVWDELQSNPFCNNNLESSRQAKEQKRAMADLERLTMNLMINNK
jgi:hypothetical protein